MGNFEIILDRTDNLGVINPFKYKGYYYDEETNLYYLKSRYYDSLIRRFISMDDYNYLDSNNYNGLNLYAYCLNNPVMYYDPSGCFAITAILIGSAIGAIVGLAAVTYTDYKDDGVIFNGCVDWKTYAFGGLLGGVIGGVIGAAWPVISTFASSTFSATLNTYGMINSGGVMVFGISGSTTISITGSQILTGVGALSTVCMFAKGSGPRMGHNQYENKQFDQLCKKYNLTRKQREILHREITKRNLSYHEIESIIKDLFLK